MSLTGIVSRTTVVFLLALAAALPADAQPFCTSPPITPTVSMVSNGVTPEGLITFTVNYNYPGTVNHWERTLQFLEEGGVLGHLAVHPSGAGSVVTEPYSIACWNPGTYTFSARAWSYCAFENSDPVIAPVAVVVDNEPSVSLSVNAPDDAGLATANVQFHFPNTRLNVYRRIDIYVDGAWAGEVGDLPIEGNRSFPLNTSCWTNGTHTVKALARSCGRPEPEFNAESSQTVTVNHQPKVSFKGFEKRPDGIWALIDYEFPQTSQSSQRRLELRRSHSDALVHMTQPIPRTGTWEVWMDCQAGTPVYATAKACSDPVVRTGDAMAPACELSCKMPSSPSEKSCCIGDPVHANSGSMEFDDRDPLPGDLVAPLVRTYQNRNPVAGVFGRGWLTIMDARASAIGGADGRDTVFLILENGRRILFRRQSGAYVQTYPEDTAKAGMLVFDPAREAFAYRDAGSAISRFFRGSDGRLIALEDRHGEGVTLTYDANGKATSVADVHGRWSWTVTYGTAGFVESIAADGQPGVVWTYAFNADRLVTVTAPEGLWRTYGYGVNGLEEIRDARGAVLERHHYDSEGRARTSFGPSGELTDIQFNLAGRVPGESRTRVVSADGKTTDYYSRFIAGRMRTVEVAGSCNCASEDSVFAHDATGGVVREQDTKGWITVRTFANGRVATVSTFQSPAGCDPATDPSRCRQTPDTLATVTLTPSALTTTTTLHYGDPHWPENPTWITTDSVVPGQLRQEMFTFDPITGSMLTHTSSGFDPLTSAPLHRFTQTALYDGVEGAEFNPCATNATGCAFSAAWLALPQPANHEKSTDGPRTDVNDRTELVYYPMDAAIPPAWQGRLAAMRNGAGHIVRHEDYDAFGHPRRIVSANGLVIDTTYDLLGRSLTTTLKAAAGCDTSADPLCATDLVTRTMYDPPAGPPAITIGSRGEATSYTYDARGRTTAVLVAD